LSADLLVARNIHVAFGGERRLFGAPSPRVDVLRGVSLRIARRETVGVVGESGSGKTTLGRVLLRLVEPTEGSVEFDGREITRLPEAAMRPLRRRMQPIFQDPLACLNPRQTILSIVTGPMLFHGVAAGRADAEAKARAIFDRFSLPAACLGRYPHELSGGQRQRVGIARAALLAPDFLLADEIVSGLDVSTQAQALNLIGGLSRDLGLAMVFISHDLSVIRAVCDRVYVLRLGEIVEEGPCETVFAAPKHEYTRALIDAIPLPTVSPDWLRRNTAAEVAA
jgi:ABC-type glutathione transport system ATPase component